MPSRIFVNYRRTDTGAVAHRIYDKLSDAFGEKSVFIDADKIPFSDFRSYIRSEVSRSSVMVVLIGTNWINELRMRADDVEDWVRIEIEAAFEAKVPIAPILVDNATMPRAEELPTGMSNLANINSLPVSHHQDFHVHMERVIAKLVDSFGVLRLPTECKVRFHTYGRGMHRMILSVDGHDVYSGDNHTAQVQLKPGDREFQAFMQCTHPYKGNQGMTWDAYLAKSAKVHVNVQSGRAYVWEIDVEEVNPIIGGGWPGIFRRINGKEQIGSSNEDRSGYPIKLHQRIWIE